MTSIIILTFNSEKYLEPLVESINLFNKGLEYEIIVVDNSSTDKTFSVAKKLGKKIKFIENKKNVGFAAGINKGVLEAKGKFLLFINPDSTWRSGNIENMIRVFDRNEMIGIIGGRMVNSNTKVEKSAGKFLGVIESFITSVGVDEIVGVRFAPNKIQKVDFVSGGFMLVKNDVYKQLHGFDENLFMYTEDMEFCFRAKLAGVLTYYTPEVSLTHLSHGSSNRAFAIKNIYHGVKYFHTKHGTGLSRLLVSGMLNSKAYALVLLGKIINNKSLTQTYLEALSA